ncbi:hypothetical protein Tco_0234006, partial [Tanacetum coccineum]
MGYSALTARDLATMQRNAGSQSGLKTTRVPLQDEQEVLPEEFGSTEQPLEQVDQNATECVDECAALANLTLDTEENKMVLKQLKNANASLTQEIEDCKTNLDETNRALGEATSCRDSCLIALQNKQNELE